MASEVHVVRDVRQAAALLDPQRLRILELLADGDSSSGIARKLGLPRQRVNYHLRALERADLVRFVEERRKGNCVERVVRATARRYLIGPQTLGALGTGAPLTPDHLAASQLVSLAARAIQEVARLAALARGAGKRLATLSLDTEVRFASAGARKAFTDDLTRAVAEVVAKHDDPSAPSARSFRLFLGAYPRPAPRDDGDDDRGAAPAAEID